MDHLRFVHFADQRRNFILRKAANGVAQDLFVAAQ
jgi:hypothetical protein